MPGAKAPRRESDWSVWSTFQCDWGRVREEVIDIKIRESKRRVVDDAGL